MSVYLLYLSVSVLIGVGAAVRIRSEEKFGPIRCFIFGIIVALIWPAALGEQIYEWVRKS